LVLLIGTILPSLEIEIKPFSVLYGWIPGKIDFLYATLEENWIALGI